jgi:hypothetical protein
MESHMQLVIKVDLDKTDLSLPEIFGLIGDCRWTDEVREEVPAGPIVVSQGNRSLTVGEWSIEEAEVRPDSLESSYRAVASARYARPGQIEVDRFATVSRTEDGAYVQGWLHVPRTDVASPGQQTTIASSPKPPQSVFPIDKADRKVG